MIKILVELYIIHALSIIIHELAHFIIAFFLLKNYEEIRIGNLIKIRITQKLTISPIIFTGYVATAQDNLLQSDNYKIILFFLSGPFSNLILSFFLGRVGTYFFINTFSKINFIY